MGKQTRRDFLKILGIGTGSLVIPSLVFGRQKAARKPNVVLIGKVVRHLDESGLRENTLIIWLSDHGHSIESRTFSGG